MASGKLILICLIYKLKLAVGIENQHPVMPEFTSYGFLTGLMPVIAIYTLVFSLFEKVQKERFVINQTNQQTRKIFCELVNSGCATVMVDSFG